VIDLSDVARRIRVDSLRAIHAARSGHPGGSLSCADILAVLYHRALLPQPYDPDDPDRDVFILSKGHAAPALHAAWATLGHLDAAPDRAELFGLRRLGSRFQGHPSRSRTPWCETSTGSLGQGAGVSVGVALAQKLEGKGRRTYALLGDGDLHEGMVAEAARLARGLELGNLTWIADRNGFQSDEHSLDFVDVLALFRACGWRAWTCDGHDHVELIVALDHDPAEPAPVFVAAMTTKGKGVPWMEGRPEWHGSVELTDAQLEEALEALG